MIRSLRFVSVTPLLAIWRPARSVSVARRPDLVALPAGARRLGGDTSVGRTVEEEHTGVVIDGPRKQAAFPPPPPPPPPPPGGLPPSSS
nr:unnamed protein product [Digitaria exilis]